MVIVISRKENKEEKNKIKQLYVYLKEKGSETNQNVFYLFFIVVDSKVLFYHDEPH